MILFRQRHQTSGKWYVVRFWKYPVGGDRVHASERICPLDSKETGFLSKGERRRRANEIVVQSGVNDAQQFIEVHTSTTFREQAKQFLNHSMTRKRNPVKPATSTTWQNCVAKWLNPNLGDLPLQSVNNQTVKVLVAKMQAAALAPKSISNYVGLVKLIVASAITEDGEEMFPRKWNHEFLDIPLVQKQKQPTFSVETMSAIVQNATGQEQVLYALLAGTGLRVGEAFGLEVGHLTGDCKTITVEQSCWEGDIQAPKTKNAYRQVELCDQLAGMLRVFVAERQSGLVFRNRIGLPMSQTNLVRRSLHPILKTLGVEKAGFHAMRRFRATWLRRQRAPEDLIQFWLGHAKQSQTDGYSKVAEDLDFRREVVNSVGTGFVVPGAMRPMRPKKAKKEEMRIAA
jgi:integrase